MPTHLIFFAESPTKTTGTELHWDIYSEKQQEFRQKSTGTPVDVSPVIFEIQRKNICSVPFKCITHHWDLILLLSG